ncbi:MAG TPA: hypothetical protein VFE02_18385 [Candidatus Acidoferrales bacterium]|nr:hypothetical protein [Candidatus Acidoferrales bacterium]
MQVVTDAKVLTFLAGGAWNRGIRADGTSLFMQTPVRTALR